MLLLIQVYFVKKLALLLMVVGRINLEHIEIVVNELFVFLGIHFSTLRRELEPVLFSLFSYSPSYCKES